MSAAVQMLNDEAIHATWQLYSMEQPVITITVRGKTEPSLNASRAPSHSNSLGARRIASGSRSVPEIPLQPPSRHISEGYDIKMMEAIADIPDKDLVTVILSSGQQLTFTKTYLTCK